MYNYRTMSPLERRRVVEARRAKRQPWHAPPHWTLEGSDIFLVSSSCYEHVPIIGKSPERMTECEEGLLAVWQASPNQVYAWCILPNHYHALVKSQSIKQLCEQIGKFHGRSSFKWNARTIQEAGRSGIAASIERFVTSVICGRVSITFTTTPYITDTSRSGLTGLGPVPPIFLSGWAGKRRSESGESIPF